MPLALVLMPEDADVDREPMLLLALDRPLEAEVESEPTLLLVEDTPVESDVSLL